MTLEWRDTDRFLGASQFLYPQGQSQENPNPYTKLVYTEMEKWQTSLALDNLLLPHCSHLDNFSSVTFQRPQHEGQNVCKRPPQVNCTNISGNSSKNKQKIAKPNLN